MTDEGPETIWEAYRLANKRRAGLDVTLLTTPKGWVGELIRVRVAAHRRGKRVVLRPGPTSATFEMTPLQAKNTRCQR